MLTLSSVHKTTIRIDDEPVEVHVKRMTRGEGIAFEREFQRFLTPKGQLTPEEKDQHEANARTFIEDSIATYVSVPAGQIVEDERSLTTGEDLIRAFCTRKDVLLGFYQAIYSENFLGRALKNALSSQPIFSPGSRPPLKTAVGNAPAPIASSAGNTGTASNDTATAQTPTDPSGASVH